MDLTKISLAEYLQKKQEALEKKMEAGKKVIMPELLEFLATLGTEGERSAVVLGAERVHMSVQGLLAAFLRHGKKEDEIFKGQGVLSSFMKKTELAYRLGLMDLKMKQALDMVRDLRNKFAHATKVESLRDQSHSDKVKALWKLMKSGNEKTLEDFAGVFQNAAKEVGVTLNEPTACYLGCIMQLLVKLELVRLHVEPPDIILPAKLNYDDSD